MLLALKLTLTTILLYFVYFSLIIEYLTVLSYDETPNRTRLKRPDARLVNSPRLHVKTLIDGYSRLVQCNCQTTRLRVRAVQHVSHFRRNVKRSSCLLYSHSITKLSMLSLYCSITVTLFEHLAKISVVQHRPHPVVTQLLRVSLV